MRFNIRRETDGSRSRGSDDVFVGSFPASSGNEDLCAGSFPMGWKFVAEASANFPAHAGNDGACAGGFPACSGNEEQRVGSLPERPSTILPRVGILDQGIGTMSRSGRNDRVSCARPPASFDSTSTAVH